MTKSKSKSTPGVKVSTRRRLGEETPRAGFAKRKRRQGKASPNQGVAKSKYHYVKAVTARSPIPMGRKDHGKSDAVRRPQVPMIRGSDKEKEKVASRP